LFIACDRPSERNTIDHKLNRVLLITLKGHRFT
jgi:hypothetical protein